MSLILVVEDEPRLLASIVRTLQETGYSTHEAESLAIATEKMSNEVDMVILDLMLPDGNGIDWMKRLRSKKDATPILVLTARDAVQDRVTGLDAGADDYLVKPFAWDELLARIRVILRRGPHEESTQLSFGPILVDLITRQAQRDGVMLNLQNRQLEILVYLMKHGNQVVTREMIARDVW
ncbi:response regulator transcription factor [Bremerella alba]|uniref:Transcriptional activator protein CopR n=1 Tax=Bremerella alba TaxID=980252 RepID=A0A7V9A7Q3_9BACT|nr:response regulator transcription factor [Bremerella alba]MBA2115592.1 Transcriptional activator protein CopR [Bremerella alba]